MADYPGKPVTFKITEPRDAFGTVLNNTNATALIDIYSVDLATHYIAAAAMPWNVVGGVFAYEWDTTGRLPGKYAAKLTVVPNGSLGSFEWTEVELQASPPPSVVPFVANWCEPADVLACGACSSGAYDPEKVLEFITVSSELLFLLSGRQFPGLVVDTGVRPNRVEWFGGRLIGSVSSTGEVFGLAPPRYSDYASDRNLGAGPISEIRLPGYPVVSIQRVRVDGVTLPPTAYKIDDDRWLARVDGQFWPVIQDLTKNPATDLATMDVDYTFGAPIPKMAVTASAAFACQMLKACDNSGDCALPPRTQSAIRQGLNVRTLDPQDYIDNGKTGCVEADRFIKAVNPHGVQQRASVLSPDTNWPAHRLR